MNRVYEDYWRVLFAICYNKTKDVQASEEIVQDIFVSLWKRGGKLIVPISIKGYLITSAKTGIIKHYKQKAKNQTIVLDNCDLCEQKNFGQDVLEHNEAIFKFLKEDIEIIIDQLPCQCQKVYRLSREKQLSTKEIASELKISQKTVKNHLTKALSTIKQKVITALNS